ncbi:MAG TPA: lipopolysaccharide biosynthesis protein [Acidobacteriaceae bacterium]|nr:lipopolysaccharide biosynthesis protein [Acidobacteriaceae bacterium]
MTVLNRAKPKSETLQARILSGSFILLSGSGLATALSFAYNISIARFLGPKGFGDATAVYTLLTLISAVTLSFQLISAKLVAQQRTPDGKYAAYRGLHYGGWLCGILAGSLLLAFHGAISNWLNLFDPLLVVLLAIGVTFYVPLGCRRGYLQGAYGFRRFATNLVLEGAVRLGGSLLLILLGMGVRGVIAANSAAVAIAYFAIVPKLFARLPNPLRLFHAMREIAQAMAFFSGQVLINNCDIVLVKHFFLPNPAGLYAAVAMVGRVIYSFSQAVVNSMFPLVAGTHEEERRDLKVIATSLLLVLTIGSAIALGMRFAPAVIWTTLFGARFQIAGTYGLPYLLALYAITTVIYSLSAVIITFEMSYKISNGSWIQLAFSAVVIAGIWRFHSSLRQVILVQLVLMLILLTLVAAIFVVELLADSYTNHPSGVFPPIRVIRRASEDEVIAEFLKSDFRDPIFRNYWHSLHELVVTPNLEDATENAKRRALFFVRNLALWNELPTDTEWYQVELREADIGRVRVFPRAQWRNLSQRSFSIKEVAEHMRAHPHEIDGEFALKISQIGDRLLQPENGLGPVIVIGISGSEPLTILDGNHRLLAAMLASPDGVGRLRFLCGLSPRMMECCWYNTNVGTLFRYGRNVVRHVARRPKAELARLLQSAG